MTARATEGEFDPANLTLPTDGICIADLRKKFDKARFDEPDWASRKMYLFQVFALVKDEIHLARVSFDRVIGKPPSIGVTNDPKLIIRGLIEGYRELGIGSGDASRREMVRQIIQQGERQAREVRGRTQPVR